MRADRRPVFQDYQCFADATPDAPGVWARVRRALATRRQRRALMALDDRMLADIGLSRSEAYREAHRSILDLPVE